MLQRWRKEAAVATQYRIRIALCFGDFPRGLSNCIITIAEEAQGHDVVCASNRVRKHERVRMVRLTRVDPVAAVTGGAHWCESYGGVGSTCPHSKGRGGLVHYCVVLDWTGRHSHHSVRVA